MAARALVPHVVSWNPPKPPGHHKQALARLNHLSAGDIWAADEPEAADGNIVDGLGLGHYVKHGLPGETLSAGAPMSAYRVPDGRGQRLCHLRARLAAQGEREVTVRNYHRTRTEQGRARRALTPDPVRGSGVRKRSWPQVSTPRVPMTPVRVTAT